MKMLQCICPEDNHILLDIHSTCTNRKAGEACVAHSRTSIILGQMVEQPVQACRALGFACRLQIASHRTHHSWKSSLLPHTFCKPTSRGSLCVPPNPGKIPRDSSGSPSFVPGVQRRALQAIAASQPPPKAMPSTAATVGLGPLSSSSQKAALILLSIPPPPDCVRNC